MAFMAFFPFFNHRHRHLAFVQIVGAVLLSIGTCLGAFAQDVPPDAVALSAEEKAWLAAHPDIRLAVDIDWAPFEFVDEQKQYRGMAAEYIQLVQERLGITLKIDKERPWPKMVEGVKNRDLDVFSLVVQTPQRDEFVNFTKPYISFPMVIVTLDTESFVDGIAALRDKKVAVVKSYASHELLVRNHPDLELFPQESVKQGLEVVSHGQAFAFVGNIAVVSQVIRESGISNLKVSGQTPYRFELRMAVRKDWPELVPILQKALNAIPLETRDEIYNRWIRVRFQEEVDFRIVLGTLGGGIFVVLIFFAWNRKLQREINHRQRAESELKRERMRLEEIIWGTNVGTWEWNVQTGETVFNERWADIIGYTLDEISPTSIETWTRYAHPEDLERSTELLEKNFSKELDRYECEVRMRHKNGTWVWVIDRGKVVEWTTDGKPLRMSGTHTDISERKKLDRMKSEFIATVSHELRTPLTSIKGALGLISGDALGTLPQEVMGMVDVAHKNTERLIVLVNDILDIEKLDSGEVEFVFQVLSFSDLVKEAVNANLGYAEEYGVTFVLKNDTDDIQVYGDDARLTQAMANLLSNAAKFSPKGGNVEVSIERNGETARVCVQDYGPGIPKDFHGHVFERFAQMDASDSRAKGGTGLGLSITKLIVEKHNGTIGFESKEGKGALFYFTLPIVIRRRA